nr:hypothetical protein [Pseudomonas hunanensis]
MGRFGHELPGAPSRHAFRAA